MNEISMEVSEADVQREIAQDAADAADAKRDSIKLDLLIAAGAARPAALAAAYTHLDARQQAAMVPNIVAGALRAVARHPRLAGMTLRLAAHNPIGARRVAQAMIDARREEMEALTVGIALWGHVTGID